MNDAGDTRDVRTMNDNNESVILVDEEDRPLGTAPKLEAHRNGTLHRAFSVLIHDGAGSMLLQKRDRGKYHSGGLWTNACCGHPRPGEDTAEAAQRRLYEEMGFTCQLSPRRSLIYRSEVSQGLIEHEYVHLFNGCWRGAVSPAAGEAEDFAWRRLSDVHAEALRNPERFTVWFRIYLEEAAGELV